MAWPIRIGVQLNPQHAAWDDLRRAAVEAGYDLEGVRRWVRWRDEGNARG
ncbi:MAG: hypothetical protein ACTHJ6_17120 [Oryzihumus sp.]